MESTVKKESAEKIPFLERPIVRTILPIAGFVIICILFAILTDGKLFKPKNISLLLSQSYMLLISSIGVFMIMTMGGLDFSQGSMLGVCSIVVCWLSHYNIILAIIGGVIAGVVGHCLHLNADVHQLHIARLGAGGLVEHALRFQC